MAFAYTERARLLATPGIGPTVVRRLEEAGFDSFERLQAVGVDNAVHAVCRHIGSIAWANRAEPLRRALEPTANPAGTNQ